MRNDFGTRPYKSRFGGRTAMKKGKSAKKQGYDDRLDESLGARHGKKSQSYKARRKESEGMEKAMGRRKYAAVKTMDKGRRKKA
jgi:hypothetical protein|tara:strand:- start:649 stop:900 length:252 start_codon:yes stop_codon:yes gene_type:complete